MVWGVRREDEPGERGAVVDVVVLALDLVLGKREKEKERKEVRKL